MYIEKTDVCTWKRQMYVHGKDRCMYMEKIDKILFI